MVCAVCRECIACKVSQAEHAIHFFHFLSSSSRILRNQSMRCIPCFFNFSSKASALSRSTIKTSCRICLRRSRKYSARLLLSIVCTSLLLTTLQRQLATMSRTIFDFYRKNYKGDFIMEKIKTSQSPFYSFVLSLLRCLL